MRKLFFIMLLVALAFQGNAQELFARVSVVASRIGNNVNKNAFNTLQTALVNFINNRKWTTENFKQNERIDCNFLLNLDPTEEPNVYRASLTIQSARPVYNSSYNSPIINFKDDNVTFKYVEFQQLEFNENRVAGNDPQVANLPAAIAYYVYMILGFDYDSFSPKGGLPYFAKAQNIVNNAPDGRGITGWKPFDGVRNRYWLVENMLNTRYDNVHNVYHQYYRSGLDKLYEDDRVARMSVINALRIMDDINTQNPNTMINQFFFTGKSEELIRMFEKATPVEKTEAKELLSRMDLTNSGRYKDALK